MKKIIFRAIALIILTLLFIGFYIPFDIGWCGQSPVLKFRFQVAEYDSHAYGSTKPLEALFETDINSIDKYGSLTWFYRLGDFKEYLGLSEIECRAHPNIKFIKNLD